MYNLLTSFPILHPPLRGGGAQYTSQLSHVTSRKFTYQQLYSTATAPLSTSRCTCGITNDIKLTVRHAAEADGGYSCGADLYDL